MDDQMLAAARRKAIAEQQAQELVSQLTHMANGWNREQQRAFVDALANDHPTLLGQVAKSTAMAVMQRATRDPDWWRSHSYRRCSSPDRVTHADHDGRLACDTVIGAELMSRQPLI